MSPIALNVMLESRVCRIEPESVEIEHQGRRIGLDNDAVVVCAGGVLPTPFLTKLGNRSGDQTRHGLRRMNCSPSKFVDPRRVDLA